VVCPLLICQQSDRCAVILLTGLARISSDPLSNREDRMCLVVLGHASTVLPSSMSFPHSPDVDHLDVVGELNPGLLVPGELRIH
jgi:hypothetical protein